MKILFRKNNDNIIIIVIIQFKFTEENLWIQYCAKDACMHAELLSGVWLCVTLWTVVPQAPLPMGLSRQAYWSGVPCPPPGGLPGPGIEPASLASPALAGGQFTTSATWEAPVLRVPHAFSHLELMAKLWYRYYYSQQLTSFYKI